MSAHTPTIPQFLQQSKAAFRDVLASSTRRVTLVAGNQSADLDSLCAAIFFAYSRHVFPPKESFSDAVVPLVNIPAADLDLRPEFTLLFSKLDIDPRNLVTLSDLSEQDLQLCLSPERTNWLLVDHNRLEGPLGEVYRRRVSGVIDHHVDEHSVPESAETRRIEVCGSCTSLVVDHFRSSWDEVRDSLSTQTSNNLARLALAAILIDTGNLKNESKVRPVDESSVAWCDQLMEADSVRDAFFAELDCAKKDIGCLPLDGILRKDYKQWQAGGMRLGMSSVVKTLGFLATKANEGWSKEAAAFMNERELDVWAVMTASVNPQTDIFGRELYVEWRGEEARRSAQRFEGQATEKLQLKAKHVNFLDGKQAKVWQQGDTTQTRKQVGPLLREAMEGGGGDVERKNKI